MDKTALIKSINNGFKSLNVADKFKEEALKNIKLWLDDPLYIDYIPQIEYLTESNKWDLLLDSFYQVIPFGTGGRRGMVGIGQIGSMASQLQCLLKDIPSIYSKSMGLIPPQEVLSLLMMLGNFLKKAFSMMGD